MVVLTVNLIPGPCSSATFSGTAKRSNVPKYYCYVGKLLFGVIHHLLGVLLIFLTPCRRFLSITIRVEESLRSITNNYCCDTSSDVASERKISPIPNTLDV